MERREGMHMAAQKTLHRLIEEELDIQSPRPRQGHHEARQRALCSAYLYAAEMGPVHLSLFTGKDLRAQKCLLPARTQTRHRTPQLPYTARITAIGDHAMKDRGA